MMGLFIAAMIPAVLFIYILIRKKASAYAVVAVFFAALCALPVTLGLQYIVHSFLDAPLVLQPGVMRLFFTSFIVAALMEECSKALCFCLAVTVLSKKRHIEFDFYYHLMLALFFGFVFSGFENISYSLRYPFGYGSRLLTTILHGMLGSFYAEVLHAHSKSRAVVFLCVAVFLHGFYNFFIFMGGIFFLPAFAILGILILHAEKLYHRR